MASKKKASEGIALLSMYNDEDDEMEDIEEQEDGNEEDKRLQKHREEDYGDIRISEEDTITIRSRIIAGAYANDTTIAEADGNALGEKVKVGSLTPEKPQVVFSSSPVEKQAVQFDNSRGRRRGTLTIVDYGADEIAMSPEAEEGEIDAIGRVMFGVELRTTNDYFQDKTPPVIVRVLTPTNQASPPQSSEPSQDSMNDAVLESEAKAEEAVIEDQKDVDSLDRFLPPPPKEKCSEELQRKINKFLDYKKAGKSFNAEVRNRKDYRNPDFLLHAVRYQDIDQIGSCFSKDVFDPHGYDKSDYYDEIEADMKREMERKEQERKRSPKVEYFPGGSQPGTVASAPKMNIPPIPAVSASGLLSAPPAADSITRLGRQNKKSKWDKVEGDRRNPVVPGGQDTVSAVGAHAALLSSTSAGVGYMAFAQQRRREAEEKRSSERKLERKS